MPYPIGAYTALLLAGGGAAPTPPPPSDAFTLTIAVPSDNYTFVHGFNNNYDLDIDWGDGSAVESVSNVTGTNVPIEHEYATAGTYQVSCTGSAVSVRFSTNTTSRTTVKSIDDWGDLGFTSLLEGFRGCSGMTNIAITGDVSSVTNWGGAFRDCTSLLHPESGLETNGSISNMYTGCTGFTSVALVVMGTTTQQSQILSACTNMTDLELVFSGSHSGTAASLCVNCSALVDADVSLAGTINSTSAMFQNNAALKTVSVSGGAVAVTSLMFANTGSIESCLLTGFGPALNASDTIDLSNNKLDTDACNALMTSLGTAPGTSPTLVLTGNPGAATCDTSIATAKNWTVTVA